MACNLLNAQPKPRNSKDFYLKLKKQYFDKAKKPNGEIKNPKGGNGRLRICNDIAAFLKYSVLEKGENTRWLAPDSTWRRENSIQKKDKKLENILEKMIAKLKKATQKGKLIGRIF